MSASLFLKVLLKPQEKSILVQIYFIFAFKRVNIPPFEEYSSVLLSRLGEKRVKKAFWISGSQYFLRTGFNFGSEVMIRTLIIVLVICSMVVFGMGLIGTS